MNSTFDLTGKTALVTGAGRGIGHHTAVALAGHGADVAVCSRTVSELEETARKIEDLGRRAMARRVDITDIDDIRSMVDAVCETFGRIDILVNNAGVNRPQPAVDVTERNWDLIMDTNLKGLFFCAQAAGRMMIRQGRGKIINISSDAGSVGLLGRAAYCASKGGVNQLTKVLALEWAGHNVHVNAVSPAFIETPLTEPMFREPGFRDWVLGNTPLGRVGRPKDVSGAVIFLASSASDYMTGHVMLVDGGWTAH